MLDAVYWFVVESKKPEEKAEFDELLAGDNLANDDSREARMRFAQGF